MPANKGPVMQYTLAHKARLRIFDPTAAFCFLPPLPTATNFVSARRELFAASCARLF